LYRADRLDGSVDDDNMFWDRFQSELNNGLRWYHVHIDVQHTPTELMPEATFVPGLDEIGLYSALCLQVLNALVEGLPPRRCADDTCPNWFLRQEGRALQDQRKTKAVLYCSNSCASRHTQRERRRRRKAGEE
jgi:hypothetical protein